MRIDLYGPAESAVSIGTATAGAAVASQSVTSPAEDRATLSSGSLSVPSLATKALKSAEARFAKVDALQQAVSNGAYKLDPGLIAQAIINEAV